MKVVHPNGFYLLNTTLFLFQRHANMFESGPFERYNYNFKWTISVFWCLDMICDAGWENGCPPSKQI